MSTESEFERRPTNRSSRLVAAVVGLLVGAALVGVGLVVVSNRSGAGGGETSADAASSEELPVSTTTVAPATSTTTTITPPPTPPPPAPAGVAVEQDEPSPADRGSSGGEYTTSSYESTDECGDRYMRNWVALNQPSATAGYAIDVGVTQATSESGAAQIVICQLRNEQGPVGGTGWYLYASILSADLRIVIPAELVEVGWYAEDRGVSRLVTDYGLEVAGGPTYSQPWDGALERRNDPTAFDFG